MEPQKASAETGFSEKLAGRGEAGLWLRKWVCQAGGDGSGAAEHTVLRNFRRCFAVLGRWAG